MPGPMQPEPRNSQRMALLAGLRARAAAIFPLGIAARLSISLAAVAALGAAAHMIARETTFVIHLNAPVSAPALPAVTLTPQSVVQAAAPAAADAGEKKPEVFIRAIDRYASASQTRAAIDSAGNEGEYLAAKGALRSSALEFVEGGSRGDARAAVAARLAGDYLHRGQALIEVADQRRAARAAYSAHFEAIDKRLAQSLDGAWQIFGRVIARQSLLRLRTLLDEIRRRSQSIVSGDSSSAQDINLLADSEDAFAASFEELRKSLERSEGLVWVRGVREDLDSLRAVRTDFLQLGQRFDVELRQFSSAHSALSTAIPAAWVARQAARSAPAIRVPSAPVANSRQGADAAVATPAASPPDTQPASREAERSNRNLMTLVTVIVISFITAISLATVHSVLSPVRRILKATADLADGNVHVQVSRGGIRELDTLAGAFNDMAARLAAAQVLSRSQHESLEATVQQRTHKLQLLAQQDPLTSLPNRRHLSALLRSAIDAAQKDRLHVGVYFLDVDNFKNFNDSLGHPFGDRVLMSVANRLEEIADGLGFVSRLGGDEFTFVYEGAASVAAIEATGWTLVNAFHELVSVDDGQFSVSVSVGASIYPEHGQDAEVLLRAADAALFRAKELGRSQLAVFTPELTETAAIRFTVEQGLRRAIAASEFELAYQPEISLATAEMGLVEALIRWRMPDGRLAKPGEFLAVAEQSGLISEINAWVLRTAIRDASRWHHGGWPDARVAINISPRQLLDRRFIEQILALLHEYRLPARCIELELTEMLLQTGSSTITALRVLHSHGIGIALDDFGTGYSSLTSLEHLPLTRIKLDRSLIASIDTSARSAAISRAIIDLCGSLGLQVTAEGIERPQQLAWLMGSHAMYLQGYLLSDAVPFAEVLQVKAGLVNKMQDLILSLPSVSRHRAQEEASTQSFANG